MEAILILRRESESLIAKNLNKISGYQKNVGLLAARMAPS
jgi:hypothetical protein